MSNHIQLPNKLFEAISKIGLSKNERRVIDLILRCSLGCQKERAFLIPRDFTVTGIKEPHIKPVIERLIIRGVICWDTKEKLFWINPKLTESVSYEVERFSEILSKNLRKPKAKAYKNSKEILTESVRNSIDIKNNKYNKDSNLKKSFSGRKTEILDEIGEYVRNGDFQSLKDKFRGA